MQHVIAAGIASLVLNNNHPHIWANQSVFALISYCWLLIGEAENTSYIMESTVFSTRGFKRLKVNYYNTEATQNNENHP